MKFEKNNAPTMKNVANEISVKESDAQIKNKAWWETLPMTYEDWNKKEREPHFLSDFINLEKNFLKGNPFLEDFFRKEKFYAKKVLEIGCGSGPATCLFAKAGADITSVDITTKAVEITKRNLKLQKLRADVYQADAEKLKFKDNYFDYLFSWGVLHHSKNTLNAFDQVSRVMKNGAEGLIMVYNKNSLRYYVNGFYWLIFRGKLFMGYNLERVQDFYTDGYYHRHFTPNELKIELEKRGLKCKKMSITHMGTRMIPFLPVKIVEFLKRKFGWLLVAEFVKVENK
jgi:ubiquinone/menaquinone biosynthesis C-methylase UbiE